MGTVKRFLLWTVAGLAVLAIGSAGAYFTAQAKVPDNVVQVGTVSVSTEPSSAALSIDGLAPGATVTRSLAVINDGKMPASVVVTATKTAGITALWEALTVRVTCEGRALYNGPLSTLALAPLSMPEGSRSQLDFAIGLPGTAGNDLQGDYVKFTLYVNAEQVH